jgi:hypothetical protein
MMLKSWPSRAVLFLLIFMTDFARGQEPEKFHFREQGIGSTPSWNEEQWFRRDVHDAIEKVAGKGLADELADVSGGLPPPPSPRALAHWTREKQEIGKPITRDSAPEGTVRVVIPAIKPSGPDENTFFAPKLAESQNGVLIRGKGGGLFVTPSDVERTLTSLIATHKTIDALVIVGHSDAIPSDDDIRACRLGTNGDADAVDNCLRSQELDWHGTGVVIGPKGEWYSLVPGLDQILSRVAAKGSSSLPRT